MRHREVQTFGDGQECACGFTTDAADANVSAALFDEHMRSARPRRRERMLETSAQSEHRAARGF